MNLICLFGFHKWIIDERESKEGDFLYGYSPFYFYEKCERCGKTRNKSPFSEKLTERIEKLNILGNRIKERGE
jgi:hypothetical protein